MFMEKDKQGNSTGALTKHGGWILAAIALASVPALLLLAQAIRGA